MEPFFHQLASTHSYQENSKHIKTPKIDTQTIHTYIYIHIRELELLDLSAYILNKTELNSIQLKNTIRLMIKFTWRKRCHSRICTL